MIAWSWTPLGTAFQQESEQRSRKNLCNPGPQNVCRQFHGVTPSQRAVPLLPSPLQLLLNATYRVNCSYGVWSTPKWTQSSPQFLRSTLARRPWSGLCVFMVSLQLISATSAYPLRPSQVASICDLQRLALYWFHAPGLQLDNEVSQSTDPPHGTVCHLHYGHRACRRAPSSGHWPRTCSRPPGAIETSSSWLWRRI